MTIEKINLQVPGLRISHRKSNTSKLEMNMTHTHTHTPTQLAPHPSSYHHLISHFSLQHLQHYLPADPIQPDILNSVLVSKHCSNSRFPILSAPILSYYILCLTHTCTPADSPKGINPSDVLLAVP